jgi:tetratricopeptide (TPR) repeat protein
MTDLAYDTAVPTVAISPSLRLIANPAPAETRDADGALRDRLEHVQVLCDAGSLDEAVASYAEVLPLPPGRPRMALRALHIDTWLALGRGEVDDALVIAQRARAVSEGAHFTDCDRAEALFRLGACQHKLSRNAVAIQLLTLALQLFERSPQPSDRLRAHTLVWRARCYQRQRDWEAAQRDVELALELAEGAGDDHTAAHAYFQASLIAERQGQWLLARYNAETARTLYVRVGDRLNVARMTNNLGGLAFLLGDAERAGELLEDAHGLALDVGSTADAAQALSSLAQVHLRTGAVAAAEQEARQAHDLLAERVDYLDELGNVELVLGRALLEQGKFDEAGSWFAAAESSFQQLGSTSHVAAAWIAQGDLATREGDVDSAAAVYRRAAEALQDFHF